jgi:hypothetical protein
MHRSGTAEHSECSEWQHLFVYTCFTTVSGRDCTGTGRVITNHTIVNGETARTGKEMAKDRIYVLSRVCVEELRKFTKIWDIMVGLQADINIILTWFILKRQTNKYTFINVFGRILASFTNMLRSLLWPSSGCLKTKIVTCWWRIVICYWTYL